MPEVKATWGKHNECNFPYWVSCDVGDVHFTAGMNTEQQARLIADRINTDPAEIEARVRKELAEKVRFFLNTKHDKEKIKYNAEQDWHRVILNDQLKEIRAEVLAIIEGDSK